MRHNKKKNNKETKSKFSGNHKVKLIEITFVHIYFVFKLKNLKSILKIKSKCLIKPILTLNEIK